MKVLRPIILVSLILAFFIPSPASAEDYEVTAVVPYELVTIPATITSPSAGGSTGLASVTVDGSCQSVAPGTVVQIMRNGVSAGSTSCSPGGFYSISISLLGGINSLVARTANLNGVFGPDSTAVEYSFAPPAASPTNTTAPSPTVIAESDLSITSPTAFELIAEGDLTVQVSIVVGGGESPYTLFLKWGDGSSETVRIETAGTYTFTHAYQSYGRYTASFQVTDVLGVSRNFDLSVMTAESAVSPTESPEIGSGAEETYAVARKRWWGDLWWQIPVGLIIFAIGLYFGGGKKHSQVVVSKKKRKST